MKRLTDEELSLIEYRADDIDVTHRRSADAMRRAVAELRGRRAAERPEPELNEVHRIIDWDLEDIDCLRCGKKIKIDWNGGELDWKECCGLKYEPVHMRVDMTVTEIKPTEKP